MAVVRKFEADCSRGTFGFTYCIIAAELIVARFAQARVLFDVDKEDRSSEIYFQLDFNE